MKNMALLMTAAGLSASLGSFSQDNLDFSRYPSVEISNKEVKMKVYLPDADKGLYRATRFDWSGVIGSVQYKGHEYFGYWKSTHDPLFHEDLSGPVEGFIEAGLGYADAEPGGRFVRIGVGVIEKADEPEYNWRKTYKIVDHGRWKIEQGKDWITFTHEVQCDNGYGYEYEKRIQLKNDGFIIAHQLRNTGSKAIETDQFNHNFFMIDGEASGTAFKISFPYDISTSDDTKGMLEIKDKEISFLRDLAGDDAVFVALTGYGPDAEDHQVTVLNQKSGAGATFQVDRPLHRMVFWSCATTLSPENFIWLSVEPGAKESWNSEYTLFVKE
jgi:hypothetical protein